MSKTVRNTVIFGGLAVLMLGAAAYFVSHTPMQPGALPVQQTVGPQSAMQQQSKDTIAPERPAPAQTPVDNAAAPLPSADTPTVAFAADKHTYSLIRDSAAYVAASTDSPQLYPLIAGTSVASVEKSADGKWIIALTEDGRAAFLPVSDLGPYDPSAAPKPPPQTVSGAATVVDTATLTIDGQTIHLDGILGEAGTYVAPMQHMIDSHGAVVSCDPAGKAYICKLSNGEDLARFALYNGAAKPDDEATTDYVQQSDAARAAHKGIWAP